jgi:hypothetical protein
MSNQRTPQIQVPDLGDDPETRPLSPTTETLEGYDPRFLHHWSAAISSKSSTRER